MNKIRVKMIKENITSETGKLKKEIRGLEL